MGKIDLINVTVAYADKKRKSENVIVLNNLSHTFEHGKFHVILGPSGCGKTTLLKTIIGLLDYEGTVNYDDQDYDLIPIKDKNIAYVSQNYTLYPRLTVFDNIAFPLKCLHINREQIINRVYELADALNLVPCLQRKIKDLSGGQQQRVAVARAIIKNPDIFIFDEPFSNLDPLLKKEEMNYLKTLMNMRSKTVLYVTHNLEEALFLGDIIHVMGEGIFLFSGTAKEYFESEHSSYNHWSQK